MQYYILFSIYDILYIQNIVLYQSNWFLLLHENYRKFDAVEDKKIQK